MRPHGQTKLGFFPLPLAEAKRLRNWLSFPRRFSALDPCVGDGVAFSQLLRDGILHIGLTPWNLLDMLRIRHRNLQRSFQNRVDRRPIHSRALHGHMGAAFREVTIRADPPALAYWCRTFASASGLSRPGEPSTSKPLPWPDVRPIHNRVRSEFA